MSEKKYKARARVIGQVEFTLPRVWNGEVTVEEIAGIAGREGATEVEHLLVRHLPGKASLVGLPRVDVVIISEEK